MSLAFDYIVTADALTGSAVRLRSVLERDAQNVNARTEDAEWLERLAAVCRERAADIMPESTDETVTTKGTATVRMKFARKTCRDSLLRFGRTFCTSVPVSHANDGQCNIRELRFPHSRPDFIIIDDPQREGFDIEKLGELEKDLGELITKRLNLAIKKSEVQG